LAVPLNVRTTPPHRADLAQPPRRAATPAPRHLHRPHRHQPPTHRVSPPTPADPPPAQRRRATAVPRARRRPPGRHRRL